MMKVYWLAVLLMVSVFMAKGQNESQEIVKVGDTMPAFVIKSDDGKEMLSTALKGKVVLINFFATWCPPCQKELAAVEKTLWPLYKDNANFSLIAIGREHSDAELNKYNEKKGFTFPLYPDQGRVIFDKFAKSLIPRSYLIGKDGKVLYVSTGYTEEEFADLMKRIEKALK